LQTIPTGTMTIVYDDMTLCCIYESYDRCIREALESATLLSPLVKISLVRLNTKLILPHRCIRERHSAQVKGFQEQVVVRSLN